MIMLKSKLGAKISVSNKNIINQLFGEDQSRYVVTVSQNNRYNLFSRLEKLEIENYILGKVTPKELKINNNITISMDELTNAYESLIPSIMCN
jgi:phosphoribosylformylglycinamidine (FGAM) synthase-like enzyme